MKAVTFKGVVNEVYDDHTGKNPVRVQVTSDSDAAVMMFEAYVDPKIGARIETGQRVKITLEDDRD